MPEQLKDPKRQEQFRNSGGYKAGQQYKASLEVAKKNLKTLVDRGVRIAMGTDTGPPARFQGFFEHIELEMMVESGMTPMQALVCGDRRCGALLREDRSVRDAGCGRRRGSDDPQRQSAREHPQHAEHRLDLDQREKSVLSQSAIKSRGHFSRFANTTDARTWSSQNPTT